MTTGKGSISDKVATFMSEGPVGPNSFKILIYINLQYLLISYSKYIKLTCWRLLLRHSFPNNRSFRLFFFACLFCLLCSCFFFRRFWRLFPNNYKLFFFLFNQDFIWINLNYFCILISSGTCGNSLSNVLKSSAQSISQFGSSRRCLSDNVQIQSFIDF